MAATYTVGQVLPNGYTVTDDTVVTQSDGTTVETMHSHLDSGLTNPDGSSIFSLQSEVITTPGANTPSANLATLQQRAQNALTANATYLALASPTNAQVAAQVKLLTQECNGLIRLLLGQLDTTTGT